MARKKKKAEQEGISAGWINTFADLMNLLLCFFVLLFSMSTVDADKYEQLVTSMTERINIFDGGGAAVGEGAFVSSGTDQLVSISEYFNEYENSGEDNQKSEEQVDKQDGNKSEQGNQSTGEKPMNDKAKAEELMAYLKQEVVKNDLKDDKSINEAIEQGCKEFDVQLTDDQKAKLLDVLKKISDLDLDWNTLKNQASDLYDRLDELGLLSNSGIGAKLKSLFQSIIDFFKSLF